MEIVRDRLDDIVLARVALVSSASAAADVARALRALAPASFDDAGWNGMIDASLTRLRATRAIDSDARVTASALAKRFALPRNATWKQVIDRIVPGLALDVAADDGSAHKRLSDRDEVAAAIVARARGLWRDGPPPRPAALCDAVVWRGLGLAGKAKRTPPEIRAHFLGQILGTATTPPDRMLRLLAAREVGSVRADLRAFRDALGRRWLCGVTWTTPATKAPKAPTLEAFATAVRDAAARATTGTFGERKVFIVTAWRALRDHPDLGTISLDDFKQRLIAAHRAGLVSLARADLVSAMDPNTVAESETRHLEARYHFIERGGAP